MLRHPRRKSRRLLLDPSTMLPSRVSICISHYFQVLPEYLHRDLIFALCKAIYPNGVILS